MNRRIRLLPEARQEFDDAADYYERQRKGLGAEFIAEIRTVLNRIAENPRLYVVVERDIRRARVTRFPYIVIYRDEQDEVIVIAIVHGARDPSVWRSRD
jgi:plasmid stabilization system protein ParE